MNMATHVKFDAFGLKNVEDQKNTLFFNLNVDPRYFCATRFLSLVAPNQICHVFQKTMMMGTKFFFETIKMFSTKNPLIKKKSLLVRTLRCK